MKKFSLTLILIGHFLVSTKSNAQENYMNYHSKVIECEELIVEGKYTSAINKFDSLFNQFNFLFLRDIKVATELSAYDNDYKSGLNFVRLGIKAGWSLESINKNKNLQSLREQPEWAKLMSTYDSLHKTYLSKINFQVKEQVHEMFKKDQKKAFGALLRIGQKAKRRYSQKKFAPHSEQQLEKLEQILNEYGYPGERLIGNNLWGSVILSHHNSISVNYNSNDTLYALLRPKLLNALKQGEISPYELAQIEDWRIAGLHDHKLTTYGFLGAIPDDTVLETVNKNRANIGLRSIDLRNELIDVENETGMDLHLPKGWQNGKITVANRR
ncbi:MULTISPECIES: hypothetical protein [Flavobacteriaceae]|jgi:hypothetical protein|uniref:Uncharacterized protein n=1 Tax=Flagellimonas taeanensis TaxID=1005926 RepID=A0A1M6T1V2_9FLAO|nr:MULTISPECIES: hypothetical protein [Allomuricauda]MAO17053.1 hypothetical protein [Allomuricauda sp.]SFB84760.1 hypothetical protein SAMN04487891_10325 [Allomuricauda taeanensis]SHK50897.1 hypothetical protein SAMN05216293_1186 [Allomuricauda taeanensis]|tara:strand:+ start:2054 stop:3034 length:981 start_codon:yes stop_codon:yes gene_type:complete